MLLWMRLGRPSRSFTTGQLLPLPGNLGPRELGHCVLSGPTHRFLMVFATWLMNTHCVSLEPLRCRAWHYSISLQHAFGSPSLLGNKYRVKQVAHTTSVVLGAKRKVSDLLRTQISMSWSFPTITSFTRLATKEKKRLFKNCQQKMSFQTQILLILCS